MSGFFRFFSKRFHSDNRINITKESEERQKNIDSLTKENVLTTSPDGKRYAIHKFRMSIYEIIEEKNGFIKVKDNNDKEFWEEKEKFYCDNIVYNSTYDFIEKEREKLLSLIDTGRYDVYIPCNENVLFGEPTVEAVQDNVNRNTEALKKFISNHTTAEFKSKGTIFSNYIIIGF